MTKLHLDNLYTLTTDAGSGILFCLLIDDMYISSPEGWVPGVVFTTEKGTIRSLDKAGWEKAYTKIEEIAVADLTDDQLKMIRRANPGDPDMDFIKVFESWGESEASMTGHMIELAVGSAMVKLAAMMNWRLDERVDTPFELTIKTEDLQSFLQNYEIERVALPHGFTFKITKSFPDSA